MSAPRLRATSVVAALSVVLQLPLAAQQPKPFSSAAGVETALGRKGAPQPDGALKFSFPRGDMTVTVRGVVVKPGLALGTWLAFSDVAPGEAMAMGDLVLADNEVEDVMRTLQDGGVEPTALHNHVLGESPRVMYMHIRAHGNPVTIATTIKAALSKTKTPLGPPAAPQAAPVDLDTNAVAAVLGFKGKMNGPVYQVAVSRVEQITERGHPVPSSMGVQTAINFQPLGGGKAATTGDFVLIASEVDAVAKALRSNGIDVTAMHSHMLDEEPRLYFMHFWGNADAATLARGLRAALDKTNSKR
jgi:hypothetical protein